MQDTASTSGDQRRELLAEILLRLRDESCESIARFRDQQNAEKESSPGDEMDAARVAAAVDAHANLIDRAEARLNLIDEALSRVATGDYGFCVDCGEQIALERLKVVPFAVRCIDCESRYARGARNPGSSARHRWSPPVQAVDDAEDSQDESPGGLSAAGPDSDLADGRDNGSRAVRQEKAGRARRKRNAKSG